LSLKVQTFDLSESSRRKGDKTPEIKQKYYEGKRRRGKPERTRGQEGELLQGETSREERRGATSEAQLFSIDQNIQRWSLLGPSWRVGKRK